MIAVSNLRLNPGEDEALLLQRACRRLRLPPEEVALLCVRRRALDARRKDDIHYVYNVGLCLRADERRYLQRHPAARLVEEPLYEIPRIPAPARRPVVVGFGPAGMFAALLLARAGARPIVLERGADAETRRRRVEVFRAGGAFDPDCNVQFGEGGAGTFSDGKLATGTHDRRIRLVLEEFALHGAPARVLWEAKPHIGTDVLVDVVQSLRADILAHGGEVRFGHRMTGLERDGGALRALTVAAPDGTYRLPCDQAVLAIGHSARDTFEALCDAGVALTPKPFAMGVRIEHLQAEIDRAQYGEAAVPLPAADYSLVCHLPNGATAYTFCMCPGGEVIAAASEPGGVVTNGMSRAARDGVNANAALLVPVRPADFPETGPLGGMALQRALERRAFALGGGSYCAPAQRSGDFLAQRASAGPGRVLPTYRPGVTWCDLHALLPAQISRTLEQTIPLLGRRLRGFDDPDAVLTAPETRSSSPVRIERTAARCAVGLRGLYPCGEGAGYAGGITSAAVDGLRCAEAVLTALAPETGAFFG